MAFDPRYGPSPFHFQPPFQPPPQHHNPAFGHPVAPPPLAPPQAYLPNRPPQQHFQPPHIHPHAANYQNPFANGVPYQQNAQFNPNIPPGSSLGQMAPQPPPLYYNPRPYSNVPQGSIQGHAISMASPTQAAPPSHPLQSPQINNGLHSSPWQTHPGLPPKPPSLLVKEANDLQGDYAPPQVQPPVPDNITSSQNPADSDRELAHTKSVRGDRAQTTKAHESVLRFAAQESTSEKDVEFTLPGLPPQEPEMGQTMRDGARHVLTALASPARSERAEESPDMYSPQETLPGLAKAADGVSDVEQHGQTAKQPLLDPYTIKQQAFAALREMSEQEITFVEIVNAGIDSATLRQLFTDLGIEDATSPVKEPPKLQTDTTTVTAEQAKQPQREATIPITKPLNRQDYIAKLKAAKGEKSQSLPEPIPNESAAMSSGSATPLKNPDLADLPSLPLQAKKPDQPGIDKTELVRQKLEALKKSTRERQQKQAQTSTDSQAGLSHPLQLYKDSAIAPQVYSNGEYTPAKPFFASGGSFSGIPGLSLMEDVDSTLFAVSEGPRVEAVNSTRTKPDLQAEYGADDDTFQMSEDITTRSGESRKRPLVTDPDESPERDQSKRGTSSYDHPHVLIELSDDEHEEGEMSESGQQPSVRAQSPDKSPTRQQPSRKETPRWKPSSPSELRARTLAAQEEQIRLVKQRILALEAKKKAKKAVASTTTPTPSATPLQAQPSAPELSTGGIADQVDASVAVEQQLRAQQDTLAAAKSAVIERIQQEEEEQAEDNSSQFHDGNAQMRSRSIQAMRTERIQKLQADLTAIDSEILNAETEIKHLHERQDQLKKQIEKGIEGRRAFTNELELLLSGPDLEEPVVEAEERGFGDTQHESNTSDESRPFRNPEAVSDQGSFGQDTDNFDAEETMDISDAEEGEISESDDHSVSSGLKNSKAGSPGDYEPMDEVGYETEDMPEDQVESKTGEPREDDYEPHLEGSSSKSDEAIEYEPDYEPDVEPHVVPDESDSNDYDPLAPQEAKSAESEVGQRQAKDVIHSDNGTPDQRSEANSVSNPDEAESEDGEVSDPDVEHSSVEQSETPDPVDVPHDQTLSKFTPYESPLRMFRSYRFHPEYVKNVPGGFTSVTFSHRIDPTKQMCPWELQGGVCNAAGCQSQHFQDLTLSGEGLILELGSVNEGSTEQERAAYVQGLRKVLLSLRQQGLNTDINAVAQQLVAYRANYLGDPSRVLTKLSTNQ